MKIVYISSLKIKGISGGSIEAAKIHLSLKKLAQKDQNIDYQVISLDKNISFKSDINISKSQAKNFLTRFFLHSNYIYIEWLKIRKKVLNLDADIIILGNSRMGFIAKEIKKNNDEIFIIGHFDNIELDYLKAYSLAYNSFKAKLFKFIESKAVRRDEKMFNDNIDLGLFLTERDLIRAKKLYDFKGDYRILGVCLNKIDYSLKAANNYDLNLIFLASLWYGSNIEAIKWFLNNVWSEINKLDYDLQLIIGGSNPSHNFLKYLGAVKNVKVYPNFKNKENIIPKNSVFISPIQTGSGMKVKVAEALSMGLAVIASQESLIGYEEAINDQENKAIINEVRTASEYIDKIKNK